MELRHYEFGKLSVSPLNMRYGTDPDVTDILPTIRKHGILLPLLVRPNGSPTAPRSSREPAGSRLRASSSPSAARSSRCPARSWRTATMPPRSKPR